jgi:shikimate dehydrogenase
MTNYKKFTIFGNPVAHSKSPNMHNFAFKKFDILANYTKTNILDVSKLKEEFFKNNFSGANVTVPYKEDVFLIADEVCGIAKDIKAVNTIMNINNKIVAYNTDAYGFGESIKDYGISKALILGAGGTAKAIAHQLKQNNIDFVIANRNDKKLISFRENNFTTSTYDTLENRNFDIIINATSSSLSNQLPCKQELLKELFSYSKYAIDVMYNTDSLFLSMAKKYNQITKDGTDMLIYQGVLAFCYFTNFKFKQQDIYKYLKKGLTI